jgi:hypothetical protein
MPLILLGPEYTRTFWSSSWYLPLIFLVAIALIDGYFIAHWRLLSLLEEENWQGLIDYLEEQCLRRGKLRSQFVRTLINAYFITNNVSRIEELEKKVREKKPALLRKFSLQFGIPKLLHNDPEDIVSYFREFKEARVPQRQWIRFLYAFGLLMKRENTDGREILLQIIRETKEPILKLVSMYTVDPFKTIDDEVLSLVEAQRSELSGRYSREALEKEMSKQRDNVVVIILSKLITDALDWLYGADSQESSSETGGDERPVAPHDSGTADGTAGDESTTQTDETTQQGKEST